MLAYSWVKLATYVTRRLRTLFTFLIKGITSQRWQGGIIAKIRVSSHSLSVRPSYFCLWHNSERESKLYMRTHWATLCVEPDEPSLVRSIIWVIVGRVRCTQYDIMWSSLSVTCHRSLVLFGTPVSSTNKPDHHDITEILLKVALSTIKPNQIKLFFYWWLKTMIYLNHSYCWNVNTLKGVFFHCST